MKGVDGVLKPVLATVCTEDAPHETHAFWSDGEGEAADKLVHFLIQWAKKSPDDMNVALAHKLPPTLQLGVYNSLSLSLFSGSKFDSYFVLAALLKLERSKLGFKLLCSESRVIEVKLKAVKLFIRDRYVSYSFFFFSRHPTSSATYICRNR